MRDHSSPLMNSFKQFANLLHAWNVLLNSEYMILTLKAENYRYLWLACLPSRS